MRRPDRIGNVRLITDYPPTSFVDANGSVQLARNGAEMIHAWGLRRVEAGGPPLTEAERAAVWAFRSTGEWPRTPVGV
jgi:hypothetical protein